MSILNEKQIIVKNNGNILAYLTKDDLVYDAWIEERQNRESRLTMTFSSLSPKIFVINDCNNEFYVDGKVFTLLNSDAISIERTADNKLITNITAIELWQSELETDYHKVYNSTTGFDHIDEHMVIIVSGGSDLSGGRYSVGSAGHALYALLQGTGWSLKECTVDGKYDLETDKKSTLSNIYAIQELWGGIIIFDSVNRTVSLLKEDLYEPFNGFQIKYGNNLKHIAKSVDNNVVTRLYVYGERGLNIASINDGREYIDNFKHTSKIRKHILPNPNITTKEYLKMWGLRQSEILGKPKETYTTSIVDLSALDGYEDVPFQVNDMCDIIDVNVAGDIPIRKRIVYKKYNVFSPCLCSLEIGDNQITFPQELKNNSDTSSDVDNAWDNNGKWDGYLDADEVEGEIKVVDEKFTRKISDVEGNVSILEQTAKSLTVRITNTEGDVSTLEQTAKSLTSRISNAEGYISTLEQTAQSIALRVGNAEDDIASIEISVTNLGTAINMKADKITLETNYVTINSLSNSGSTVINGDNITTGTISANRINTTNLVTKNGTFSGSIEWGGGSSITSNLLGMTTIHSNGAAYIEAPNLYIVDGDTQISVLQITSELSVGYYGNVNTFRVNGQWADWRTINVNGIGVTVLAAP